MQLKNIESLGMNESFSNESPSMRGKRNSSNYADKLFINGISDAITQ